jgi:predicted acyl esterase
MKYTAWSGRRLFSFLGCVVLLTSSALIAAAQASSSPTPTPTPFPDPPVGFKKSEQMIPMRDGVKLYTIIYTPVEIREPLPFIFFRTPYGVSGWGYRAVPRYLSTWFPVIDRNPQKFVPNIFQARDSDYQSATQRISRSKQMPSYVELPVRR